MSQESVEQKETSTTGPSYRRSSSSNQYLTTTSSSEPTMPSSSNNTHITERQIKGTSIDPMKKYFMTLDEFFNVVGKNVSPKNKNNDNDPDGLHNNTKINQLDKKQYEDLLEQHRLDDERTKILPRQYSYSPKYDDNKTRQNQNGIEMPPDIKGRETYNGYETNRNRTSSSSDVPPLIPQKYPNENLRNHDESEPYDERSKIYKYRRPSSGSPPRSLHYANDVEQMRSLDHVYKQNQDVRYIEIRDGYSPYEIHESRDYNKHDITRQHDNIDETERHHKNKNRHLAENPTSFETGVSKYHHGNNQRSPATMCLKTGAVSTMPVPTLLKYNSHDNQTYPPRLIRREESIEETLRKDGNEDAIDIDGEDDASFGSSATSDELNHKEIQYSNVNSSSTNLPYYQPDGSVQPSGSVIEKKKRGGGKLGRKRRRGYIYDPKPLVRKSKPNRVPTETKDPEYWDKRQRNNEAAKRSRENRRQKELEIVDKAKNLNEENESLQNRIKELEAKNSYLEQLLSTKNSSSCHVSNSSSSCHDSCGQKKFT